MAEDKVKVDEKERLKKVAGAMARVRAPGKPAPILSGHPQKPQK